MRTHPTRPLVSLVLISLLALGVAACGGSESAAPPPPPVEPPAETQPPAPAPPPPAVTTAAEPGTELPDAVARTRGAIIEAAQAFDYDALEALLDPATFSYSFGESGDPIGYWRELEEVGEVPILGDFLPVVLSMHVGTQDGIYVWPAAHAKEPSAWTEDDLADMRQLYTDEQIDSFERFGGYLGYRVGIREDGAWLFFVAGD